MIVMNILIQTVGGSDTPLVKSIKASHADHIYFICSESVNGQPGSVSMVTGQGKVCGGSPKNGFKKERPNIMVQSGLTPDRATIYTVDPDDPEETHRTALSILRRHVNDSCIVDFTGGTKSMVAGLFCAGTEMKDVRLTIVTGRRTDIHGVTGDHSYVRVLEKNGVYGRRRMQIVASYLEHQDYEAGIPLIEDLFSTEGFGSNKELASKLEQLYYFCNAFSAWDKFQYEKSTELMELYLSMIRPQLKKEVAGYKQTVSSLAKAVSAFDQPESLQNNRVLVNMYRIVYDVIRNAERKASRAQYDDAVARLYRATELYAQVSLLQTGIRTSDVDMNRVEQLGAGRKTIESLRARAEENGGKVQIPLRAAYELLAELKHPTGEIWEKMENKLTQPLTYRNYSLLAHGIRPVSAEDYRQLHQVVTEFVKKCDAQNKYLVKSHVSLTGYGDLPRNITY